MHSLLDGMTRNETIARVQRLAPGQGREWGKMTVDRMIVHVTDGLRISFAELRPEFKPSLLSTRLAKWLVISSPIPWPKGKVQAPPGFFTTGPVSFESDRATLIAYLERFAKPEAQTWGASPLMGPLTAEEWGRLNWRHCDHHLRQFGI